MKTLSSTIGSLFVQKLSAEEMQDVVDELVRKGIVTITGTKVTYALPEC